MFCVVLTARCCTADARLSTTTTIWFAAAAARLLRLRRLLSKAGLPVWDASMALPRSPTLLRSLGFVLIARLVPAPDGLVIPASRRPGHQEPRSPGARLYPCFEGIPASLRPCLGQNTRSICVVQLRGAVSLRHLQRGSPPVEFRRSVPFRSREIGARIFCVGAGRKQV